MKHEQDYGKMMEEDAAASWAYSLCHFTVTSTSLSKMISSLKWLLNRISYGNYRKKHVVIIMQNKPLGFGCRWLCPSPQMGGVSLEGFPAGSSAHRAFCQKASTDSFAALTKLKVLSLSQSLAYRIESIHFLESLYSVVGLIILSFYLWLGWV